MKKKTVWTGTHKGIYYEIQEMEQIEMSSIPDWFCGYIYLPARSLTEEGKAKYFLEPKIQDGYSQRYINFDYFGKFDLDGMNGGCTYYDLEGHKVGDVDQRCAKIGWDYAHSWDVG